ncbi:AAA family ATPase [Candidatus Gracilibacteria bacterium]|nr:AAA family ATPase [Candidatus Gracilibacteria bacterium]
MILQSMSDVIILYGPPLAGKGTQVCVLQELLKDYFHLDFGTELRKYIESYSNSSSQEEADRAKRLQQKIEAGEGVLTEDLRYVVESRIENVVDDGGKLLIEGPGRLVAEAEWLSKFFAEKKLSVTIFHLHIDLDTTLARAKNRWYCKGYSRPFTSKEEAITSCKGEPYRRYEDQNEGVNISRYKKLYDDQYALIIQTYQLLCQAWYGL